MDGHLVAVEVGVERRTHQRMHLYSTTFDQHRLECLDTQAVQCWRAIQKDRAFLDDIFQYVPDLWPNSFGHALCTLDIVRVAFHDQSIHDEGFE